MDLTLIGGPTALLVLDGLRLLTDPTFDPPGRYPIGDRALVKTAGPAIAAGDLGHLDAVLLSHDQHPDNLDRAGRALLEAAPVVLSTPAAAERLGGRVLGLAPWATHSIAGLEVTAVPALHGPPGSEPLVGEVTGFVLTPRTGPRVYVSGDNASLTVVREIAERCGALDVAVLHAGAARTPLVGDADLTLGATDAVRAAEILGAAHVVVIHTDGWAHFTQDGAAVRDAFAGRPEFVAVAPGETVQV